MKNYLVVAVFLVVFIPLINVSAQELVDDSSSCVVLNNDIGYGDSGADVLKLQNFLAGINLLSDEDQTSYFGNRTQEAVKQFQCQALGICSGAPDTNGHGRVGYKTRATVTNSCIIKNATANILSAGSVSTPQIPTTKTAFVEHLYQCVLGRTGTDYNIKTWYVNGFKDGVTFTTISKLYQNFFNSGEYQNISTSNDDFVTQLYNCILYREPDAGGKATWVAKANAGMKRSDIITSFINSAESKSIIDKKILINLTRKEKTTPLQNDKNYWYEAGDSFVSFDSPIRSYVTPDNKQAPCTNKTDDASDNCVPIYRFYALFNAYPVSRSQNKPTVRNWFESNVDQSLTFWGGIIDGYPDCNLHNLPTTSSGTDAPEINTAYNKTRITFANGLSYRYAPTVGNRSGCPTGYKGGPSFAVITSSGAANQNIASGIGLFTLSGKGFHNEAYRGFGPKGQNDSGANAGIAGTFFNFVQTLDPNKTLKPFTGNSTDNNALRLELLTKQSVHITEVSGENDTQAKQQTDIVFANDTCLKERSSNPDLICQVNYLLNNYINRKKFDYSGYSNTTFTFDSQQGGMPYIDGKFKAKGQQSTISYGGKNYGVFTSLGEATIFSQGLTPSVDPATKLPKTVFEDKVFGVQISYAQFTNYLKIVATDVLKNKYNISTTPEKITSAQMTKIFGSAWNDKDAWFISRLLVAQEAHNDQQETARASIGGNVKSLQLRSLP